MLHVPLMHAYPVGAPPDEPVSLQSANDVHAAHTPATHACPLEQLAGDWHLPHSPPNSPIHPSPDRQLVDAVHEHDPPWHVAVGPHWLPVVQAPQTPAVHTCPWLQSLLEAHAGVHIPAAHASPVAQSLLTVQVHSIVECVAVQAALGPHWLFVEQFPHFPAEQIWPAAHWPFDVHGGAHEGSPLHATQTLMGKQVPSGPPPAQ
jgi:hypothetical protein